MTAFHPAPDQYPSTDGDGYVSLSSLSQMLDEEGYRIRRDGARQKLRSCNHIVRTAVDLVERLAAFTKSAGGTPAKDQTGAFGWPYVLSGKERQGWASGCAGDALPGAWCGRPGCAFRRRDACTTVSDPLDTMLKIIYKSGPVDWKADPPEEWQEYFCDCEPGGGWGIVEMTISKDDLSK